MICPLHGPVWRKGLGYILNKYAKWAAYEPEVRGVLIAFASVYGGRRPPPISWPAAWRVEPIPPPWAPQSCTMCLSPTTPMYCPRPSSTATSSLPPPPTTTASSSPWTTSSGTLAHHALRGRKVALIQNGSWARQRQADDGDPGRHEGHGAAGGPGHPEVHPGPGQDQELEALARTLAASVRGEEPPRRRRPSQRTSPAALCARSVALSMSRIPSRRTSPVPSAAVPPAISSRWPEPCLPSRSAPA